MELVERGETTGENAESTVSASVRPLLDAGADIIVLGCTHYPFLADTIGKVASGIAPERDIRILDPAPAVARHLLDVMKEEGLPYFPPATETFSARGRHTDSGKAGDNRTVPADDRQADGTVRLIASGPSDTLHNLYSSL